MSLLVHLEGSHNPILRGLTERDWNVTFDHFPTNRGPRQPFGVYKTQKQWDKLPISYPIGALHKGFPIKHQTRDDPNGGETPWAPPNLHFLRGFYPYKSNHLLRMVM